MARHVLTILAFVIAALPASGAAYGGGVRWNKAPVPTGVNLPDPQHTCAQLLAAASFRYHTDRFPKTSETIGKLYATAIGLNGQDFTHDNFDDMTLRQLIVSYADVMGCFVSHRDGVARKTPPSPLPMTRF